MKDQIAEHQLPAVSIRNPNSKIQNQDDFMNKDSEQQPTIPRTCDLCGLPLRQGTVTAVFSETTYSFCCLGCRQVFNILLEATGSADPAAFKKTDLFKQTRDHHCRRYRFKRPPTRRSGANPIRTDGVAIPSADPQNQQYVVPGLCLVN
jgi:hypothetical protein